MTIGVLFWVLYIVFLVFGLWAGYPWPAGSPWYRNMGFLLIYILIGLIGWRVFGAPVHQ